MIHAVTHFLWVHPAAFVVIWLAIAFAVVVPLCFHLRDAREHDEREQKRFRKPKNGGVA